MSCIRQSVAKLTVPQRVTPRAELFQSCQFILFRRRTDRALAILLKTCKGKDMTIFEKIASRQIAAQIVHETDDFMAIHDVNPQAPIHVLIVPKRVIPRIAEARLDDGPLLGSMLLASREIAEKLGVLESGYVWSSTMAAMRANPCPISTFISSPGAASSGLPADPFL